MRRNTVAVPNMMDPREWLSQHLAEADPDLVRSMLATFAEQLMSGGRVGGVQCRLWGTDAGACEQPQWVPGPRVGHQGRHD